MRRVVKYTLTDKETGEVTLYDEGDILDLPEFSGDYVGVLYQIIHNGLDDDLASIYDITFTESFVQDKARVVRKRNGQVIKEEYDLNGNLIKNSKVNLKGAKVKANKSWFTPTEWSEKEPPANAIKVKQISPNGDTNSWGSNTSSWGSDNKNRW